MGHPPACRGEDSAQVQGASSHSIAARRSGVVAAGVWPLPCSRSIVAPLTAPSVVLRLPGSAACDRRACAAHRQLHLQLVRHVHRWHPGCDFAEQRWSDPPTAAARTRQHGGHVHDATGLVARAPAAGQPHDPSADEIPPVAHLHPAAAAEEAQETDICQVPPPAWTDQQCVGRSLLTHAMPTCVCRESELQQLHSTMQNSASTGFPRVSERVEKRTLRRDAPC